MSWIVECVYDLDEPTGAARMDFDDEQTAVTFARSRRALTGWVPAGATHAEVIGPRTNPHQPRPK